MKFLDIVIIGGIMTVGFMIMGGNGSPLQSGSSGWNGGNNISGGNLKLPPNVG